MISHPRMCEIRTFCLQGRDSLCGTHGEHPLDQVLATLRNAVPRCRLEVKLADADFGINVFFLFCPKRRAAAQEGVKQYSQTPHVSLWAVALVQHLWGHIVDRANKGTQLIAWGYRREGGRGRK